MSERLLISFSGMDGAGKSTQIENLRAWLQARGRSVRVLAFWDDVVVLSRYREGFVHKVFKSERGIGMPGKPVRRRDKNVRAWYLTLMRLGLYLLDALSLRRVVARARRGTDVLIMDRYIYDELSNLAPQSPLTRPFVRLVGALVPKPDIPYVLDADPVAAAARKPEYPAEFLEFCRDSYLKLAAVLGLMVVPALPLDQATEFVARTTAGMLDSAAEHTTQLQPADAA